MCEGCAGEGDGGRRLLTVLTTYVLSLYSRKDNIARIQKVLLEGSNSVFRGVRLQRPTKAGNYRPARETPLKWRFAGGPIMSHR